MKPSLKKLHKIFSLEAERGYDNNAVVGGLDRILESWIAEARADSLPEDLIQAVGVRLRDYRRLSESSRAEALRGLWTRLQRETEIASPLKSKPEPQKEPPPKEILEAEGDSRPDKVIPAEAPPQVEPVEKVEEPPTKPEEESPKESLPEEEAEIEEAVDLNAPVTETPGVGKSSAKTLSSLDLETLRDVLYHFPRRYDDYTKLKPINRLQHGEQVTVIGTVKRINIRKSRNNQKLVEDIVSDGSGSLRITWFNQPWMAKRLRPNTQVSLAGKIDQYLGRLVMTNPATETLDQQQLSTNRIVPVYPSTTQITQRRLRRVINQVVMYWASRIREPLPASVCQAADLMELSKALRQVHFPDGWDELKAAQYRLAFEEIFLLQLGVLGQKHAWQERSARVFETPPEWLQNQLQRLPYELTHAQHKALEDVLSDLSSGKPMNRLLQGDVGSGKTIVAALAAAAVNRLGTQTALMAPTSILAEQHYKTLTETLAQNSSGSLQEPPLKRHEIRLMIGATPESEKEEIRSGLEEGSIKIVVGTHALIQDPVNFADLELAIIDEQHRFGVNQRAALRAKGHNPHLMVMTATPIPRSLALTIYGDLDITVIDEMPPGRQEVGTHILTPRERERAYTLIRAQVKEGRQAFIIYPLVEESEQSDSKAAVEEQERLQSEVFPDLKLGLLHGRLKGEEKETVMQQFHAGQFDILVSTTVVEVGVDVPNATVMLIEGANRFGLAQLHQLRGRVGRGGEKSYCLLIPESADEIENERLQVMVTTNDGFVLAEYDLEQRGPGEFLGTRQAGFADLKMANLTDVKLIEKARRQAQEFYTQDPKLEEPSHQPLAEAMEYFWGGQTEGDIS